MDQALLKKISVFAGETALAEPGSGQGPEPESVIKADFAVFHETPDKIAAPQGDNSAEQTPALSDYEAGLADGQAQAELLFKDTIAVMQNALDSIQSKLHNITREIELSHLSALSKCWDAISPALVQNGTAFEIQSIIQNACDARLQGYIQIEVHPDDRIPCEQLCQAFDHEIRIESDPSLAQKQIRIQWRGGGAEVDCAEAAKQCQAQLQAALTNLTSKNPGEKANE